MALGGCRPEAEPESNVVSDLAERGPLRFEVTVQPKEVLLGDPIEMSLRMHAPEDYVVLLPEADELGELEVRASATSDPLPTADGGLDWRRTYTVDSYSSGTLEIPPLVAKYARRPEEPDGEPEFDSELVTGTLKVEVRSALTSQDSMTTPRDITGTLSPQRPMRVWPWAVVVAIVAGVVCAGILLLRWSRRRHTRALPPMLPEVWALRMLGLLLPQQVESGQAREFYYSLSEVVRAYIEKKFTLAAPEMTTEEFLALLARDRAALPYDADRLRDFMEACDIVKYAAYAPRREDAEGALQTARAFVNATAAAVERSRAEATQASETHTGGQAA
ncbi:MAG: hypothetical protein ABIG44_00525 [Planctomycetota bacterium]